MKRTASVWVGPAGEVRQTGMHNDGETAFNILRLVIFEEMKSTSEDPIAAADDYMRSKNLNSERYPAMNVELLKRGWVIIDDGAWEIPHALGKDKESILRAEDQIMQYVSKGPILLIFEGAGGGIQLSLDDVEESPTLSDAIELAKTRPDSPEQESFITNFNLGFWTSARERVISYFR
jgi:hypothetical protein